jgi:hypothetical protein
MFLPLHKFFTTNTDTVTRRQGDTEKNHGFIYSAFRTRHSELNDGILPSLTRLRSLRSRP